MYVEAHVGAVSTVTSPAGPEIASSPPASPLSISLRPANILPTPLRPALLPALRHATTDTELKCYSKEGLWSLDMYDSITHTFQCVNYEHHILYFQFFVYRER